MLVIKGVTTKEKEVYEIVGLGSPRQCLAPQLYWGVGYLYFTGVNFIAKRGAGQETRRGRAFRQIRWRLYYKPPLKRRGGWIVVHSSLAPDFTRAFPREVYFMFSPHCCFLHIPLSLRHRFYFPSGCLLFWWDKNVSIYVPAVVAY